MTFILANNYNKTQFYSVAEFAFYDEWHFLVVFNSRRNFFNLFLNDSSEKRIIMDEKSRYGIFFYIDLDTLQLKCPRGGQNI